MKRQEINIRDPYVLVHNGMYYLYGTRSETAWSAAEGFDCYVSRDLNEFQGPFEIFHKPEGFFADRYYWAPECCFYNGAFYLVTTFGGEQIKQGIYILKSDCPTGPFNGPWSLQAQPFYPENGGHGMFFKDLNGRLVFTLHSPNDLHQERPIFWTVKLEQGKLMLDCQI